MAGRYNIETDQAATFRRTITWTDADGNVVNTTTYSARMQVRNAETDAEVITLTNGNGRIVLGPTSFDLTISAADTEDLSPGSYVYDLFMTAPDGTVRRD